MYYKNVSCITKTFYDVTFNPGDEKEVPGYINDKYMIVIDALKKPAEQQKSEKPKSETKAPDKKPSSESQKKEAVENKQS